MSVHTDGNLVTAQYGEYGCLSLPIRLQNNTKPEKCWENLKSAWVWVHAKYFDFLYALK